MSVLNFVVETAAIGPGLAVKKGTAANGVVIAGAGEQSVGVSKQSTPEATDTTGVGDHVSVAAAGEKTKVLINGTLAMGADVAPDAAGKAVAIGSTAGNKYFRLGYLAEGGVAGELVDIIVTCDWVTIPA